MMEEPVKQTPERREYTVRRWMLTLWLVVGLTWIAMAVFALATARARTISIPNADGTYTEVVDEPSGFDRYKGIFFLAFGIWWLVHAATYWDYRVVMDETGVRVRSFLLGRRVRWDEVRWSNVWHKKRVVLGTPRGRSVCITIDAVRRYQGLMNEILPHLQQPRLLRVRYGLLLAVIAVGVSSSLVAPSTSCLPWLVASGAGAVAGFMLVAVVRAGGRSRAVLAWTICAGVAVIAWGVSAAFDLAGWPRVWLAVGIIGGWLFGFTLARMHEETMRGTPGADWAREVKPPSTGVSE